MITLSTLLLYNNRRTTWRNDNIGKIVVNRCVAMTYGATPLYCYNYNGYEAIDYNQIGQIYQQFFKCRLMKNMAVLAMIVTATIAIIDLNDYCAQFYFAKFYFIFYHK